MKNGTMKKTIVAVLASVGVMSVNVYADDMQPVTGATTETTIGTTTGTTQMQPQAPASTSANQAATAAGDAFLAANKTKPGVVTLPDGLQYKVIEKGTGQKPSINDSVTVHYAGTLINGTEFDSSIKRGQPVTFPVNAVIPGWVEALQMMPEGSTWELYIPSKLAYGVQGAPPAIGPNETLIFKVQLIKVNKS